MDLLFIIIGYFPAFAKAQVLYLTMSEIIKSVISIDIIKGIAATISAGTVGAGLDMPFSSSLRNLSAVSSLPISVDPQIGHFVTVSHRR